MLIPFGVWRQPNVLDTRYHRYIHSHTAATQNNYQFDNDCATKGELFRYPQSHREYTNVTVSASAAIFSTIACEVPLLMTQGSQSRYYHWRQRSLCYHFISWAAAFHPVWIEKVTIIPHNESCFLLVRLAAPFSFLEKRIPQNTFKI